MHKLRFREEYHVEILEDTVFLLSEVRQQTLTGRLYALIAPFLNGNYTIEEIVKRLQHQVNPSQVHYTVNRLLTAGHITHVDESLPVAQKAYWSLHNINAVPQKQQISVHTFGVETTGLADALAPLNIEIADNAPFSMVLVDDYLNENLMGFNTFSLAENHSWMLVKPVGAVLWIGPVFTPDTACWVCLEHRLKLNRAVETFLHHKKGLEHPISLSRASLPSTEQTAFHLAATESLRWLNGYSALKNTLVSFDTLTLTTTHHTVIKRAQCPVCGHIYNQSTTLALTSRKKTVGLEGSHRSASAQETYERFRHHVSPITGIIHRLERVSGTGFLHIYDAGPNKSRPFDHWQRMRSSLRSSAAGKGTDDLQARVSGLCEALERYSGVFDVSDTRITAAYQDIAHDTVHPSTYLQFSPSQYTNRENWNAHCPPHLQIPEPFDETRRIEWSNVWSLTDNRFKRLPTAYCYYHTPLDYRFCIPDSNGNAAGSSLEDAILQGFMELVERDSVAIWWYNRVQRPGFDINSLCNPYIDMMKAYYRTLRREFWVLDLTTDLNIPAFAALSRRTDKPQEDIIMGFGAHFDATVAVMRALTELNQMLPSVIGEKYHSESSWEIEWWQQATLDTDPYLAACQPLKTIESYPSLSFDDLREEVMHCVNLMQKHGMEILVLDQTRPDVGLPVVKVIVPGLRHFWARYAPGRLYDVPVKMGWQPQPTPESQLNPWYMSL